MPPEIHTFTPDRIAEAKLMILRVAHEIYAWPRSFEETVRHFEAKRQFRDIEEVQTHYFENGGCFLMLLDEGRLVGTGAVQRIDEVVCELKRLWLLPQYQGQGLGYQLMQKLFAFARSKNYRVMRLLTDVRQARAINFYERLGFERMDCHASDEEDVCMEIRL